MNEFKKQQQYHVALLKNLTESSWEQSLRWLEHNEITDEAKVMLFQRFREIKKQINEIVALERKMERTQNDSSY